MKKIWLFLGIAVIFGAAAWFFAAGYDYKKDCFCPAVFGEGVVAVLL